MSEVWFAGHEVYAWEPYSEIYGPFVSEDAAYQAIEVFMRTHSARIYDDWQVFSRELEDGNSTCPLINTVWRDDDDEDED